MLLLAAALITTGCRVGEVALEPPAPAVTAAPDPLVELIRYGNRVRQLDRRELAQQYRSLAFGDAFWSNEDAIRLSLLLSAPNTPYHDTDQAARLLRDVIERDGAVGSEKADLAELLHYLLSERVYAESEDQMLAALLSDARDRNERLNGELDRLRAELDAERERSERLQAQIDALKRLEEQLSLERFERP